MLFQPEADLMAPLVELNKTVNIQVQSEGDMWISPVGLNMLFQPEADLMAPPAELNKIELYTLCQLVGDLTIRPAGLLSHVVNIPVVICEKTKSKNVQKALKKE